MGTEEAGGVHRQRPEVEENLCMSKAARDLRRAATGSRQTRSESRTESHLLWKARGPYMTGSQSAPHYNFLPDLGEQSQIRRDKEARVTPTAVTPSKAGKQSLLPSAALLAACLLPDGPAFTHAL